MISSPPDGPAILRAMACAFPRTHSCAASAPGASGRAGCTVDREDTTTPGQLEHAPCLTVDAERDLREIDDHARAATLDRALAIGRFGQ